MNHPVLLTFKEVLETDFALFYLNDIEDTLITKYKESIDITLEIAIEALKVIIPFKDAGSKFAIIDVSEKFITITPEARKHFKVNVSPHNTNMVAVVVNDFATKAIANIYARFDKPRVPTRVFTDSIEALNWIEDFKE